MKHILDLVSPHKVDFSEFDPQSTKLEQDADMMVDLLAEKARHMGFSDA